MSLSCRRRATQGAVHRFVKSPQALGEPLALCRRSYSGGILNMAALDGSLVAHRVASVG